jgi:hypothetical protein
VLRKEIAGKPMSTSSRKTVRVPVAADGVPIVVHPQSLDKTREIKDGAALAPENERKKPEAQGTPREIHEDDITVPVHSSIESSLTFEVLRRQSTDDEGDKKK